MGCSQSKLLETIVMDGPSSTPTGTALVVAGSATVTGGSVVGNNHQPINTRDRIDSWAMNQLTTTISVSGSGNGEAPSFETANTTAEGQKDLDSTADTVAPVENEVAATTSDGNAPTSLLVQNEGEVLENLQFVLTDLSLSPAAAASTYVASSDEKSQSNNAASSTPTSAKENRLHSKQKQQKAIETQWKYLLDTQSSLIVDPIDVASVLDALMTQVVNLLSPTEVLCVQRKIRSLLRVKMQTSDSNTSSAATSRRILSSSSSSAKPSRMRVIKDLAAAATSSSSALATLQAQQLQPLEPEVFRVAEKHHLLHYNLVQRIFTSAFASATPASPKATPFDLSGMCLANAYSLMLHLSESLWSRVAEIAKQSAHSAAEQVQAGAVFPKPSLVLPDLSLLVSGGAGSTPSSSTGNATNTSSSAAASALDDDSLELPPGVTLQALLCILSMALRGTRRQRLQLLFYLCIDPAQLQLFLRRHFSGGVPCWLFEADSDTVVSWTSLAHYHYYSGLAILPHHSSTSKNAATNGHTEPANTGATFIASQSRQPPTVLAERVQKLCLESLQKVAATSDARNRRFSMAGANAGQTGESNFTSTDDSTMKNSSHTENAVLHQNNIINNNGSSALLTSFDATAIANASPMLKYYDTPLVRRLACGHLEYDDPQLEASLTRLWNETSTAVSVKNNPGNAAAAATVLTNTNSGTNAAMRTSSFNVKKQKDNGSAAMVAAAAAAVVDAIPTDGPLWTLADYFDWAEIALDNIALDAIMHELFATGLIPTHTMEREMVQAAWLNWQTEHANLIVDCQSNGALNQQHDEQSSLEQVIAQSVRALIDVTSCNGGTTVFERNGAVSTMESPKRYKVWGGLGGIDGCGGLGYGLLYCVDMRWWNAWADYVGWTWMGERPSKKRKRQSRPGSLSTEFLLDRSEQSGTLGSYELMRLGLRKNRDYMLIPPEVWDVLYELYSGGPPLPRMVQPNQESINTNSNELQKSIEIPLDASDLDSVVEALDGTCRVARIPECFSVVLHPWIIHVHLCDPLQPYRRGEAGSMSIRVMVIPDEPLWRVYAELVARFTLQAYKAFGADNFGKARLWRKIETSGPKDPASRYGPWSLLCKSRHAILPLPKDSELYSACNEQYQDMIRNWKMYTDNATVESIGLSDHDHLMLEFAVLDKMGDFIWPREAAAKDGKERRIAEEDIQFRQTLLGVDDKGLLLLRQPDVVGMEIDAMDSSGRWYSVKILQSDIVDEDTDDDEPDDEVFTGKTKPRIVSRKKVKVDFCEYGGHQEWIDVESDRVAMAGRFTSEAEKQNALLEKKTDGRTNGSYSTSTNDVKPKSTAPLKKSNSTDTTSETGKICLLPGYGACGLTNLGNTCYINSAIQCISYLPLLRAYLLSCQFRSTGDINRENPLGTGGKLLEEFADLLRHLWSGRMGEKSPTKFRSQLGKANSQFSGADQQDAQEFLNYILDVLLEDSNKVRKKPYVEALEDDWVTKNTLPRVGDESWRRFLRRNRSIMTDVAMGQVLNTVTCPTCNFQSRNFDPFNLLSIPIPTVADVLFQCTVYRRATAINCPWVLNKPRKGDRGSVRFVQKITSVPNGPPSETFVAEQYIIAMSRLADSGDLRLQIQNACGIPANLLRLYRAEEVVVNKDARDTSVVRRQTKITALTDKEGPCSQLAKKRTPGIEDNQFVPTLIVAYEATLRPRTMPRQEAKDDLEPLDDTADEDDEGELDNNIFPTIKEQAEIQRYLEVYGDRSECRLVDTNPLVIAKAVSRSLWPRCQEELRLGLRVDAKDHRGNWYPGSVVEINDDEADGGDIDTGEQIKVQTRKVRVHFDNFSSKWDESYNIDDFDQGKVRPLYSHSSPRPKPTEFCVHHRHTDRNTTRSITFGQSFHVQCQNEWSNARAGAHILAQASRFMRLDSAWSGTIDVEDFSAVDREGKARRLYEKTQSAISELIDLLIDCDKEYVNSALNVNEHNNKVEKGQFFRNPTFDPTLHSASLAKKVSTLLPKLPFEVRVCSDASLSDKIAPSNEEIGFPFSLIRTIGNYMNVRHAILLQWRDPPVDKKNNILKSYIDAPVMYVPPQIEIDQASIEILKHKSKLIREESKKNRGGSAGIDLGVCLTEFCKVQNLTVADSWTCPHCKEYREGRQSMNLWRLPDLLTFHIKRFNMSARWREKITTKVKFPVTGLDMSEWCHSESPMIQMESSDAFVYDLIGVMNHYGSMTGGHYVATCKATICGREGREEVSYNFNGVGANAIEMAETDEPTSWRLTVSRAKMEANQSKAAAVLTSKAASASAEPLWLQFDDELVEPLPPRHVVSEMAYVLFYRRRRMTPSNIAKYSTLE